MLPYENKKIKLFLKELSSDAPVPGGGSAAALTGALGAALLEMAAGINAKREFKKTHKVSPQAKSRIKKLSKIRFTLLKAITEDAQAFQRLSRAFKFEKSSAIYQNALKNGAQVPLNTCQACVDAMEFGVPEIERTSRFLASDVAEAGILLDAAFLSARFNVLINLKEIQDKALADKISLKLSALAHRSSELKDKLVSILNND